MEDNKDAVVAPAAVEIDPIAAKDAEIAKLKGERDNYKTVALKRLGKLPADQTFLEDESKETGLTVEEQVKKILIEKEITRAEQEKDAEIKKINRENAELRLALKNRPNGGIGGDSGSSGDVKDNVFSDAQLADLKARAARLKADPEKFIEAAKRNLQKK